MKPLRPSAINCILLITLFSLVSCQTAPDADLNVIRVPFKLDRNRVIIPTSVNGSKPLNLILDTGMRFDGVYLFHKEFAADMDTTGAIEVKVPGAGAGEASTAVMIESGRLDFGGVTVDSQRVLISSSPHTQTFPTDGIIGWNLFGHYTVEINYDEQIIILHDTAEFIPDPDWHRVPVTMKKDMPFLECELEVVEGEIITAVFYIDLASGDALEMLMRPDQKYTLPDSLEESYLGTGLSGDIHGYKGFSRRWRLGRFDVHNVATSFAPAEVRSKQEGADGILGNDAIRRFNIVFDYPRACLYVKPNSFFEIPFE